MKAGRSMQRVLAAQWQLWCCPHSGELHKEDAGASSAAGLNLILAFVLTRRLHLSVQGLLRADSVLTALMLKFHSFSSVDEEGFLASMRFAL